VAQVFQFDTSSLCRCNKNDLPALLYERRFAGWYIFKPKIPIGVNFGDVCRYILWQFVLFYFQLVNFVAIWYILRSFGIFFPCWYVVPRKIWQSCARVAQAPVTLYIPERPRKKNFFQTGLKLSLAIRLCNSKVIFLQRFFRGGQRQSCAEHWVEGLQSLEQSRMARAIYSPVSRIKDFSLRSDFKLKCKNLSKLKCDFSLKSHLNLGKGLKLTSL
jgi:hypothetical protein